MPTSSELDLYCAEQGARRTWFYEVRTEHHALDIIFVEQIIDVEGKADVVVDLIPGEQIDPCVSIDINLVGEVGLPVTNQEDTATDLKPAQRIVLKGVCRPKSAAPFRCVYKLIAGRERVVLRDFRIEVGQ